MIISPFLCCIIVTIIWYLLDRLHHFSYLATNSFHHWFLCLVMVFIPLIYFLQVILNLLGSYFLAESSRFFSLLKIACYALRSQILRLWFTTCFILRFFFVNCGYLPCNTFWIIVKSMRDLFTFWLRSVKSWLVNVIHFQKFIEYYKIYF